MEGVAKPVVGSVRNLSIDPLKATLRSLPGFAGSTLKDLLTVPAGHVTLSQSKTTAFAEHTHPPRKTRERVANTEKRLRTLPML
jgi:hypothetical protein